MNPAALSAGSLLWLLTLPAVGPSPPSAIRFELPRSMPPAQSAPAQPPASQTRSSRREFFIAWGYNGDSYANSDLHIRQPSLGNEFTLVDVRVRDSKAWTDLFNHSLFVPQYNFRIGMFFNEKWGVELALDHMKWIVREDQQVRITGTLNGASVDGPITLTSDVLRYQLNNGANPVFFNLIRRIRLAGTPGRPGHLVFLAKGGGGFAWPHTENTVFGQNNDKGFQPFHGWNVDAVAAVRARLFKGLYFEFEEKLVYARYFGVKVHEGEARHSVKANEFVWNFGWTFGG